MREIPPASGVGPPKTQGAMSPDTLAPPDASARIGTDTTHLPCFTFPKYPRGAMPVQPASAGGRQPPGRLGPLDGGQGASYPPRAGLPAAMARRNSAMNFGAIFAM